MPSSDLKPLVLDQGETPGQTLARVLLELAPEDRPLYLQHLEKHSERKDEFLVRRALQEYREMSRQVQPKAEPDREP